MWRYALAHKPLCERFQPHVWRIGGAFVCRSCTLTWLAAGIAFLVLMVLPASREFLLVALPAVAVPVVGLSVPVIYDRWSRTMRDLLRVLLGAVLAMLAATWLSGAWIAAGIATVLLWVAHRVFVGQHRRRAIDACAGCPELDRRGVCTGFNQQADALRAYDSAIVARARVIS